MISYAEFSLQNDTTGIEQGYTGSQQLMKQLHQHLLDRNFAGARELLRNNGCKWINEDPFTVCIVFSEGGFYMQGLQDQFQGPEPQ
jgi:hypothetical protein